MLALISGRFRYPRVAIERPLYICLAIIAYGVALQQLLELFDGSTPNWHWKNNKKFVFKIISAISGTILTAVLHPGILSPLELAMAGLGVAWTAEVANSLLKVLVYRKETQKASAALAISTSGTISMEALARK